MKLEKRVWIALLITIVICWFGYFYFEEKLFFNNKDIRVKWLMRLGRFFWLFLIAAIGFWALVKVKHRWVKNLWLLIYSFIFFLLIIIGIIDFVAGPINENFREFISSIRLFFASPLPLAFVYILYKNFAALKSNF